ncbi:uncharacterized protein LOC141614081 [Silene latifolia]|uniref:uncharacterized protein LOC141614081 n=1 Tax=Silene latifolia TaxID=37657 RepID=UPI003D78429F
MRGVMRFGKQGKLSQNFIGLYEILDKVGEAAYGLALSPALERVPYYFHVSQLRKYVSELTHVLEAKNIELDDALTNVETLKRILDHKVSKTRLGETLLVKVLWSNNEVEDATREDEETMKKHYPLLFDQV